MEEKVKRVLREVARFWGYKEVPLPRILEAHEDVIRSVAGRNASAVFLPEKGAILVPEGSPEGEMAAELSHFLRYLHVGERGMLERKPLEEFVEHVTTRGLGLRKPLTPGELRVLKRTSIDLMKALAETHRLLEEALSRVSREDARNLLEGEKKKVERYLEFFIRGRSVDLMDLFQTLSTAENMAKLFNDSPNMVEVNYHRLIHLDQEGLQEIADHWPYLLAEEYVEEVRKRKPRERRRLLENIHDVFPQFVLSYLEKEDPYLFSYLKKIVGKSREGINLSRVRFYKNLLLAKLRGKTVKVS